MSLQEAHKSVDTGRRHFLKHLGVGALGAAAVVASPLDGQAADAGSLQVWSCGGLAEAMRPAHEAYKATTGVSIAYTGAFAGALGKSLLSGSGTTEVFAGRVLQLAQNLRKSGKMLFFKPLCFTSYGIAVPKGNPGKLAGIEDLSRKGLRLAMAPLASPPGGQAVMGILKASGLAEKILPNVLDKRATCVQRTVDLVASGGADAMLVEKRITRMPSYQNRLDFVEIPETLFPAGPLTFTVGVMRDAHDKALAEAYVTWLTGAEGQAFFEHAGFIPARSQKGQELVARLGGKDVD